MKLSKNCKKRLDIPVFHDDQHGTAIVILAGLINAGKVLGVDIKKERMVINGAGAAAIASVKLLHDYGFGDIVMVDSNGIISKQRNDLNTFKQEVLQYTNKENIDGDLTYAVKERKIFLGLSVGGILKAEMVKAMKKDSVVIAMANPEPEILPELAKDAGARIVATGRSDYPNQINNVLGFPGIFRGLLDKQEKEITMDMKIRIAEAMASLVKYPTENKIIPNPFEKEVVRVVAAAV